MKKLTEAEYWTRRQNRVEVTKTVSKIAVVMLLLALFVRGCIVGGYSYSVKVEQYLSLADDASTAKAKLAYLHGYKKSIRTHIVRNDARYIFKKIRLTRDEQLKIIDTLLQRLTTTSEMDPKSFEYQQAMAQLSGQEFNHTLEDIDYILWNCWLRQHPSSYFISGYWLWAPLGEVE